MENEVLLKNGLYLDEISKKVRLLNPDYHQLTSDLVLDCVEYLRGTRDFKAASEKHLAFLLKLKKITERQKYEVIHKRSQLMSMAWYKQVQRNKMYMEMREKRIRLERARQQYESLLHLKSEHSETLLMLCRR